MEDLLSYPAFVVNVKTITNTSNVNPAAEKKVIFLYDSTFSILVRTFAPPNADTKRLLLSEQVRSVLAYSFLSSFS